jgi:ligand-binding SRPBCC domain-containing protein
LSVRVTAFERPTHFADVMVRGAFKRMEHNHFFESIGSGTRMIDVFSFEAPLWILGRIAESLFLTNYMRVFLVKRNLELKATAESDSWRQYLKDT